MTNNESNPSKRILFIVTSHDQLGNTGESTGFHLAEATHPYYTFVNNGYEVVFASPKGGEAPMTSVDRDDALNARFLEDPEAMRRVQHTLPLDQVVPGEFAAVYFPGGHGTMWDFPENEQIQHIVREIYENGGVVGAVCHGPAALVNVQLSNGSYLVEGKTVSAFTNAEEKAVNQADTVPFLLQSKLEERGATHRGADNFQAHVERDGNLVTGQNPASAKPLAEAILQLLPTLEPAAGYGRK